MAVIHKGRALLRRVCKLLGFNADAFDSVNRDIIWDQGNTVPTDETDGYGIGCIFQHRDGGEGTAVYINEGTEGSCDFNPVACLTAAQEASFEAHLVDGTIHFTEASIDHTAIQNIGTNSHADLDTHIADGTLHFVEGDIDHTAILNIGSNTHAQIDTHIADGTIHFAEASIDHGSIAGLDDVADHSGYLDLAGTRTMTGSLEIEGDDIREVRLTTGAAVPGCIYSGYSSQGSLSSPTAITSGKSMAILDAYGYGDSGFLRGGRLAFLANETFSDSSARTTLDVALSDTGETIATSRFLFKPDEILSREPFRVRHGYGGVDSSLTLENNLASIAGRGIDIDFQSSSDIVARIRFATQTASDDADMIFYTADSGVLAEVLRLTSDGIIEASGNVNLGANDIENAANVELDTISAATTNLTLSDDMVCHDINGIRFADQFDGASGAAKIQAAHDDLPAGGGIIFAPAGTYTSGADDYVTISKNNVIVCGVGASTICQNDVTTANRGFFYVTGDHCTIRDLRIQNNNGTQWSAVMTGATGGVFENIRILEAGSAVAGLVINTPSVGCIARGCLVTGMARGIYVLGSDNQIYACTILEGANRAIDLSAASRGLVSSCYIDMATGYLTAIELNNSDYCNIFGNVLTCTAGGAGEFRIKILSTSTDVIVSDNILKGTGTDYGQIWNYGDNVKILGNQTDRVYIESAADNCLVADNHISNDFTILSPTNFMAYANTGDTLAMTAPTFGDNDHYANLDLHGLAIIDAGDVELDSLTAAGSAIAVNSTLNMGGNGIGLDGDGDSGLLSLAGNEVSLYLGASEEYTFETTQFDLKGNNIVNGTSPVNFPYGFRTIVATDNVADPPTDAQLDTAFGAPATVGDGFIGVLDDNNAETDSYICWARGSSWFYAKGTIAA